MRYRELAEDILEYVTAQEREGTLPEVESLYYIEGIIEDFMRKKEYFASE